VDDPFLRPSFFLPQIFLPNIRLPAIHRSLHLTAEIAEEPSAAFGRNQNDPTAFKSVVRVILHYIATER
jgi:hypothetical protein